MRYFRVIPDSERSASDRDTQQLNGMSSDSRRQREKQNKKASYYEIQQKENAAYCRMPAIVRLNRLNVQLVWDILYETWKMLEELCKISQKMLSNPCKPANDG